MNYQREFADYLQGRAWNNWVNFMVYGVFAGLLLANFILTVPPIALGIGAAACAGTNLLGFVVNGAKKARVERGE